MLSTDEVVLAMPSPTLPVRHARSTVLIESIANVRHSGRFGEYTALLSSQHRDALLGLVAGAWTPVDVAFAHYEACDRLDFTVEQQLAYGRATFDRARNTLLGGVIRMAREAGVTPWNVFPHFQRFWSRAYDGNGVAVYKLGPKEARIDVVQNRLYESRYYRGAVRGIVLGITDMFCKKSYVTEKPGARAQGTQTLRVQWA